MNQKIININIKELVLWTENPRDPIKTNATDQEIADRAISKDSRSLWSLKKLFEKMGPRFDFSEIPTVAYVNKKPVVYDGNRRVLIGKIIHEFVTVPDANDYTDFDFPREIPCNVCDKQTALEHVDRKHAESGSWKPLERDIFKHEHMEQDKSAFLIIENATKLISNNPCLNQRFVKEEIFDSTTLHKLGFSTNENKLQSQYKENNDAQAVLDEIIHLVEDNTVTTRKNRGKITSLISQDLLKKKGNSFKDYKLGQDSPGKKRKTPIVSGKSHGLFGKKLLLKAGTVNNLYSDLLKLYEGKDKNRYSEDFPMIIRMGLRLLCEIAGKEKEKELQEYISNYFDDAKKKLSQDEKTTLSNLRISSKQDLIKLLHSGGHGYTASKDVNQMITMSLIIGKILEITHGK